MSHSYIPAWWYMAYIALILHVNGVPIIIKWHTCIHIHIHPESFTSRSLESVCTEI